MQKSDRHNVSATNILAHSQAKLLGALLDTDRSQLTSAEISNCPVYFKKVYLGCTSDTSKGENKKHSEA